MRHLAPPGGDFGVVGCAVASGPVNLWRHVVDGLGLIPCDRVGENAAVLPIAARTWVDTVFLRHRTTGASHASRRNAIAHPWLHGLNHIVNGFHHAVHVVASPVAEAQACARIFPFRVVASRTVGGNAAGIEIVVVENAVHIIVGDNLAAHIHNAVDGPLLCRVEDCGGGFTIVVREQVAAILQLLVQLGVPV